MTADASHAARSGARLPIIDIARGAALVAMFGYHLTWDLAHFGYIGARTPFSPGMRLFSHVIACSFLAVAGVSLALARRSPFAWGGYWRRMLVIAGAGGLVTLASWLLFPNALILFGILQCIAAASLVALPFLFLPWPAALAAGGVAAVLPFLFAAHAFDGPWLDWTGLNLTEPTSNDFRPLLPWAAALLFGLGVAQFALPRGGFDRLARIAGTSPPARLLAFGGRHSLTIYLVHQPVFFALLSAAVWAFPPQTMADEAPFRAQCERQCLASGSQPSLCVSACACAAREMKRLGLWTKLQGGRLDDAENAIVSRIAKDCAAQPTRR
ncbi:MAG: DUF1624 domain-containing protein [Methylobacteriaceae bacterium]|nr:DUF1624 domain-containing protein [Methylobacteriaceae bacterium]